MTPSQNYLKILTLSEMSDSLHPTVQPPTLLESWFKDYILSVGLMAAVLIYDDFK